MICIQTITPTRLQITQRYRDNLDATRDRATMAAPAWWSPPMMTISGPCRYGFVDEAPPLRLLASAEQRTGSVAPSRYGSARPTHPPARRSFSRRSNGRSTPARCLAICSSVYRPAVPAAAGDIPMTSGPEKCARRVAHLAAAHRDRSSRSRRPTRICRRSVTPQCVMVTAASRLLRADAPKSHSRRAR